MLQKMGKTPTEILAADLSVSLLEIKNARKLFWKGDLLDDLGKRFHFRSIFERF